MCASGARLCQEIHAGFPTLPVVLATGYAELPEGAGEIGEVVRLTKPFSQKELSRALAEACEGGALFLIDISGGRADALRCCDLA